MSSRLKNQVQSNMSLIVILVIGIICVVIILTLQTERVIAEQISNCVWALVNGSILYAFKQVFWRDDKGRLRRAAPRNYFGSQYFSEIRFLLIGAILAVFMVIYHFVLHSIVSEYVINYVLQIGNISGVLVLCIAGLSVLVMVYGFHKSLSSQGNLSR